MNSYTFSNRMQFTREVQQNFVLNLSRSWVRNGFNGITGRIYDHIFCALQKTSDQPYSQPSQYQEEQVFRNK